MRSLILERAESRLIKEAGIAGGMRTLRQDAIDRLFEQRTTVNEVLRVTHDDGNGA